MSNRGNDNRGHSEGREAGGEASARTPGSAANLATYLKGIDLPCSKDDLLRHAEQNGAPDEVRSTIQNMPDQQFETMPDVMKAFGEVK